MLFLLPASTLTIVLQAACSGSGSGDRHNFDGHRHCLGIDQHQQLAHGCGYDR
jgi:hypothetical protein